MLLRLAPDASRSSPGDGVHKPPSPFCKAGTKRYMLCPHAYGTFDSCATCRSGVRRSNRMEVGRRQGRHSLQRSACTRRTARRDLWGVQSRLGQRLTLNTLDNHKLTFSRTRGDELSKLRDLETGRSRNDRELGRRRRCAAPLRTAAATRTLSLFVSGWSPRSGLSADGDGIFSARCSARPAFPDRRDSGWPRHAHPGIAYRAFHRTSGISSATARGSCAASTAETTRTRSGQQVAYFAAELRRTQRCAPRDQSTDEQTRSTVVRFGGSSSLSNSHCLASRVQFVAARMRGDTD
jgi:hypothetical protein